jgi:hypothetical protein
MGDSSAGLKRAIMVAAKKLQKRKLIVHRGWHACPMTQHLTQRFRGGMRSKEKGKRPNTRSKK